MKHRFILGALLLAAAPFAFAQSTAEIRVTGEIVPNACTPVLSDGGHIALGTLDKVALNPAGSTGLPPRPMSLSVTCSGPASVGYSITDNRPGTATGPGAYGLGLDGASNPIGSYNVLIKSWIGDGAAAGAMISQDQGATWQMDAYTYWGAEWRGMGAGTTLGAFTTQEFQLDVWVDITGTDNLDFASPIMIDGSATFVLHYL